MPLPPWPLEVSDKKGTMTCILRLRDRSCRLSPLVLEEDRCTIYHCY
jgi:hypothetical protein